MRHPQHNYEPAGQLNPFGGTRNLAYDQYVEMSKQTRLAQANLAVNAVQAGLMAQMRDSLVSITSTMDEVRQHQADALAIQQELLQREQMQGRLEEFIYNAEKLVVECSASKSELPPSSRYFMLLAVTKTVEQEGIGTPIIRGRDNKAAFETVVNRVHDLLGKLSHEPEVKEAIQWAKTQQRKIEQDRQQREAELNQQLKLLTLRLDELRKSRKTIDASSLIRERMEPLWEKVRKKLPENKLARVIVFVFGGGFILPCILPLVAYAIWLKSVELPKMEHQLNESVDQQIVDVEGQIHSLKNQLANLS